MRGQSLRSDSKVHDEKKQKQKQTISKRLEKFLPLNKLVTAKYDQFGALIIYLLLKSALLSSQIDSFMFEF